MSGGQRKRTIGRLFAVIAVVLLSPILFGGFAPAQPRRPAPSCPPGQFACLDAKGEWQACSDHSSDRRNCGACGKECQNSEKCVAGACVSTAPQCPAGQFACLNANGAKGACSDHSGDRRNCGACGKECQNSEKCVAGACVSTAPQCPAGQFACLNANGAKGACSDHSGDRRNCGACGKECQNSEKCVAGACVSTAPQCPAGQFACLNANGAKGACSDHATDRNNCGGCGKMCRRDQSCRGGACQ